MGLNTQFLKMSKYDQKFKVHSTIKQKKIHVEDMSYLFYFDQLFNWKILEDKIGF